MARGGRASCPRAPRPMRRSRRRRRSSTARRSRGCTPRARCSSPPSGARREARRPCRTIAHHASAARPAWGRKCAAGGTSSADVQRHPAGQLWARTRKRGRPDALMRACTQTHIRQTHILIMLETGLSTLRPCRRPRREMRPPSPLPGQAHVSAAGMRRQKAELEATLGPTASFAKPPRRGAMSSRLPLDPVAEQRVQAAAADPLRTRKYPRKYHRS